MSTKRTLLIILCCSLAAASIPLATHGASASGGKNQALPPDLSKPYALVVGDSGQLYVFDGSQLFQFPTPSPANLTEVRWRHDGAYALAVGRNDTLLKITVANSTVSVTPIPTGLDSTENLETISWTANDSLALIAGPGGKFLLFDGQKVTIIPTDITKPIFASAWSTKQNIALVVGQSGLIAEFNGTHTSIVAPPPTNFSFFAARWNPSGSFALVGGDHAKLFEYQDGSFTEQNTAVLFEVAPHLIRDIEFNQDNGIGLISGQLGLTVTATQTKCEYNVLYNANKVCLSFKRIQYYTGLDGTKIDLHRIGHFYAAGWMPGTEVAYAVGTHGTIARITSSAVTLLLQNRTAGLPLKSIDWQPKIRASNPQLLTWYLVASGSIGFTIIFLAIKRKTLKEWLR